MEWIWERYKVSAMHKFSHQLSRHGIEPGSLIPVESQILSTEP